MGVGRRRLEKQMKEECLCLFGNGRYVLICYIVLEIIRANGDDCTVEYNIVQSK